MAEEREDRTPVSLRLSPTALSLMDLLGRNMGLSRTAVVETAVRRWAREEGLWWPSPSGADDGDAGGDAGDGQQD